MWGWMDVGMDGCGDGVWERVRWRGMKCRVKCGGMDVGERGM